MPPTFAVRRRDGGSFVVRLARLDENGSTIATFTLNEGSTVFGRGPQFGITDQRVSRRHCSIVVDSTTRSITLLPNSTNLSYLVRSTSTAENSETWLLQPNEPVWQLRLQIRGVVSVCFVPLRVTRRPSSSSSLSSSAVGLHGR